MWPVRSRPGGKSKVSALCEVLICRLIELRITGELTCLLYTVFFSLYLFEDTVNTIPIKMNIFKEVYFVWSAVGHFHKKKENAVGHFHKKKKMDSIFVHCVS